MNECKLCAKEVTDELFINEYEICYFCFSRLNSLIETLSTRVPEYQDKANNAQNPEERIKWLSLILNMLYEYKILYYDNDVDVLEQNVDDLIDEIIDCISYARE